jgi:hypothetical protein
MGSQYEVIYPGNKPILFDGGLDTKFEKTIIPDNESPDCLNVVFSNGAVATRPGSSKLNTATVGTFVCDGLYTRRDDDGSETMIAFHGGTARYLAGTSFHTIPSALSVFTAGIRVGSTQYRDCIFIGNGGVIPYKYNGTDFTRHGVYPITNTASAVSNGAGNIQPGSLSYKFTSINSYAAESDLSAAAITITVTNSCTVSVTSIPVAPQSYGVNSRRVYRYGPSNTTYVLVGTIGDNTTTSFSDNSQVGTVSAPSDNGVPPKFSVCIYHANRLWVNDPANPNYAWYSELGEPFTFGAANFLKVGDASSDLVKGFDVYDSGVVINCENSQVINYMEDPADETTWRQVKVRSSFGSKSPFGTWRYNNRIGFPAFQNTKFVGFAALHGDFVEPTTTALTTSLPGSDLLSDKIESDMFNIQEPYVGNVSSIVYKNKAYISVTYGSTNTTNNRVYLFDFSMSNLSKSQRFSWVPFTGLNAAQFAIYGGSLYYGSSSTDGFIYQLETSTYDDNGSAINSYYWTKEFSGKPEHENLPKDFRKVKILADLAGAYYMNLSWKVDSDKGVGQTKQIDLNPGGSLWGTMRWGIDLWGGGKDQYEFEIPLGQTHGKRIQFKFDNQNTANHRFKIHRMTFLYNVRGST